MTQLNDVLPGTNIKVSDLLSRKFKIYDDATFGKNSGDLEVNIGSGGIICLQRISTLTDVRFENPITEISQLDTFCDIVLPKK